MTDAAPSRVDRATDEAPPHFPSDLEYRKLRDDEFWRRVPGFADVDAATFLDHRWQARHSVTRPHQLFQLLGTTLTDGFAADVEAGLSRAPMSLRVSPYILGLIDWTSPEDDPLRLQFIPLGSRQLPDHPMSALDSLKEQRESPVPGLTHRYPDKVLFVALDTCPVYCRFCTRSYAVGLDTRNVEKIGLRVDRSRWEAGFGYIESRSDVEDVVLSGGDTWQLRPEQLREIGERLLGIEHIRRVRVATRGPSVVPMKLLTDDAYLDALLRVVELGRSRGKAVAVHTHFNHANEITAITRRAVDRLFQRGVTVRNQTVLQRGVNDSPEAMARLIKRLGYINVQPYYVHAHDMVKGVEELRTTVGTAMALEKRVRGVTAGFHTPTFVVDAPGGGGTRDVHSAEVYDRTNGIAVYTSPGIKAGRTFVYFDPVDQLPETAQARWRTPTARQSMIDAALSEARSRLAGRVAAPWQFE